MQIIKLRAELESGKLRFEHLAVHNVEGLGSRFSAARHTQGLCSLSKGDIQTLAMCTVKARQLTAE